MISAKWDSIVSKRNRRNEVESFQMTLHKVLEAQNCEMSENGSTIQSDLMVGFHIKRNFCDLH